MTWENESKRLPSTNERTYELEIRKLFDLDWNRGHRGVLVAEQTRRRAFSMAGFFHGTGGQRSDAFHYALRRLVFSTAWSVLGP